jgi:serine O-acetyltransferase
MNARALTGRRWTRDPGRSLYVSLLSDPASQATVVRQWHRSRHAPQATRVHRLACAPRRGDRRGFLADFERALARVPFFLADVAAIWRKDPALRGDPLRILEVPLYASFWAMLFYRLAHPLYWLGVPFVPRLLSQIGRFLTGIEIHPGAVIGWGLFIDHGMGVVIGETAIVGCDVLLFHGVTLGGVDARPGRRHPLLGDSVVVGAGAKILGAITIGSGAKVGAQSVVLSDVPPNATAVGIPARVLPTRSTAAVRCCAAG